MRYEKIEGLDEYLTHDKSIEEEVEDETIK